MENITIVDEEEVINKGNNHFPWMGKITNMCKDAILDPNIKRLDDLIATFLTDVEKDVKQCYCKPRRAEKLKTRMNSFLICFHEIYLEIKKPLEHTSYLDKISDIMSLYIDLELKSSKRKREDPKKIAHRICSCLFIFLDKSIDHMLDAVLKSRYFGKTQIYSDICEPIIGRLLKDCPGYMYDTNYVRYLLSFKLWKKLAGKERFLAINKEAVTKLRPPPDFIEKLKCGAFTNVLPFVAKSEKDRLTLFFMQSPFNIKKKAEIFLKDCRRNQPVGEFEHLSIEDDFESSNLFDYNDTEPQGHGSSLEIMKDMWNKLMDRELNSIDDLISSDSLEDTNRMMVELNVVSKHAPNSSPTQLKFEHCESKVLHINASREPNNLLIETIPKEESTATCMKVEQTLNKDECKLKPILNSETNKINKPCATVEPVEPDTCKEIEADSQSLTAVHRPIIKPIISSVENNINSETNSRLSCTNVDEYVSKPVVSSENNTTNTDSTEVNSAGIVSLSYEGKVSATDKENDKVQVTDEKLQVNRLKTNELTSVISVDGVICNNRVLEYNNEVAEEVEIDNTTDAALDVLMNEDVQNNRLDQRAILNVIGVSNDVITIPATTLDPRKSVHSNKDMPPLEKQNNTSDEKTINKKNNVNDTTTTSPENQFLSSFLGSSDNYVSLGQDTYTYNDLMISHYLSEVNADEVSDDERRLSGKLGAFRDQTKESKSDSEEFETPSPESRTDSISVVEASPGSNPPLISTQPRSEEFETPSPESRSGSIGVVDASPVSNPQLNPTQPRIQFEEEISPPTLHQDKEAAITDKAEILQVKPNLDCPQLKKRVSVDVTNLDMVLVNSEKINSKGMFAPPDSSLHSKTFTLDVQYELGVDDLFNLTRNSNVFNSTNHPPIAPPSFEIRCQCPSCTEKYICLVGKYQQLLLSISRLEDVKLTKLREGQDQQEMLLKSIQDSLNDDAELKNQTDENDKEIIIDKLTVGANQEDVKNSETICQSLPVEKHNDKMDSKIEDSNVLKPKSCLPPKKRKSFSLPSQRPLTKLRMSEFPDVSSVDRLSRKCENNNNNGCESVKVTKTQLKNMKEVVQNNDATISVNSCKTFKTKIVAIDGSYCVIPQWNDESLSTSADLASNINDYASSKENKTKSCCYRKRKEEKKLRRERKRLKRQRKAKLMADEKSSKSSY